MFAAASPTSVLPAYEFPATDAMGDTVYVSRVDFVGARAMPVDLLAPIVQPYLSRRVTFGELLVMRNRLTLAYVEAGYVTSGAVLRSIDDGVLTIELVEGRLTGIEISGDQAFRPGYVSGPLAALQSAAAVNVHDLERKLQLLQQDPHIDSVVARLLPGARPGEAHLYVEPIAARRFSGYVEFANDQSPSLGGERLGIGLLARNLSGRGDDASLSLLASGGVEELDVSYTVPIDRRRTRLAVFGKVADSEITEPPFDELDIEAESRTWGLALTTPVWRTPGKRMEVGVSAEYRRSRTFLLGSGFSFSPGPDEGEARAFVVGANWNLVSRSSDEVLTAGVSARLGVDAFDATINSGSVPDGEFTLVRADFGWLKRFAWLESQLSVRTAVQLADGPLLGMEQLPIGGRYTVRGFRENTVTRDSAILAGVEWRVTAWSSASGTRRLDVGPFVDFGYGWNEERDEAGPRKLVSAGLSVDWTPVERLNVEVAWGRRLRSVSYPGDHDLQDDGVHLRVNWQAW